MALDSASIASPCEQMKAWRISVGSMAQAAKLCGLKTASAWAYYESPGLFNGKKIPEFIQVAMGLIPPKPPSVAEDRLRERFKALASLISIYRAGRMSSDELVEMLDTIVQAEVT